MIPRSGGGDRVVSALFRPKISKFLLPLQHLHIRFSVRRRTACVSQQIGLFIGEMSGARS
jgi:hypothetical protein